MVWQQMKMYFGMNFFRIFVCIIRRRLCDAARSGRTAGVSGTRLGARDYEAVLSKGKTKRQKAIDFDLSGFESGNV